MIFDYLRSGYRTFAKFGQDPQYWGEIIWYRAQPGAEIFPHRSQFRSLVWSDDRWELPSGLGEQSTDRTWSPTAGPILPGTHYHGQLEWFLTGIPSDAPALDPPCGAGWQYGAGGGAAGGTGLFVPSLSGGGAAGGIGPQLGDPRFIVAGGGGAAGGIGPQLGDPRFIVAGGGGAAGGVSGRLVVALGGGAAGGVGDQASGGGVLTDCCDPIRVPETLVMRQYRTGTVVRTFNIVYDPTGTTWRSLVQNYGGFGDWYFRVTCVPVVGFVLFGLRPADGFEVQYPFSNLDCAQGYIDFATFNPPWDGLQTLQVVYPT